MENITTNAETSDIFSMEEGAGTASLTSREDWPTEEECSILANLPAFDTTSISEQQNKESDKDANTSTSSDALSQSKSVVLPHSAFDTLDRRYGATSAFTRKSHTFPRHPNHQHGERMSLSGMRYAQKVLPIVKEDSQEKSQEKNVLAINSTSLSSHNNGSSDEHKESTGSISAVTMTSADDIALAVQRGWGMAISADSSTMQDIHCGGVSTLTSSDHASSSKQQQRRGKLGGSTHQGVSPPPSEQSPPKSPPKKPLWFFIFVGFLVSLIVTGVISATVCGLGACNSMSSNSALDGDPFSSLPPISLPTLAPSSPVSSVDATLAPSSWRKTRLPTNMPTYTETLVSSSVAAAAASPPPPPGTQNRTVTRGPRISSPPVPTSGMSNTTSSPAAIPSPSSPTKSPNRPTWPTWTNMPVATPPESKNHW
jgi:hypothetical protein